MPTLILSPRQTADSQTLWRAASRLGWRVERLSTYRVPEYLRTVAEPVLYLEVLFAQTLAAEFGLMLYEPPVDWLPRLPEEYRRRAVTLSTLGEARGRTEPVFIKPPNDKSFAARVYLGSELPEEYPNDDLVLVAEVVQWEKEFRGFILDRELRTLSIYLRDGVLQRDAGFEVTDEERSAATAFYRTLLADPRVDLPRAAVVDVGLIAGRGWAVVEQNAAWGAGIYGCDAEEVLAVLRHTARAL